MGVKGSRFVDLTKELEWDVVHSEILHPAHLNYLQKLFFMGFDSQPILFITKDTFMSFLDLPESVTHFGEALFWYICSLEDLTITHHSVNTPRVKKSLKDTVLKPTNNQRLLAPILSHPKNQFDYKQIVRALARLYQSSEGEQLRCILQIYKTIYDPEVVNEREEYEKQLSEGPAVISSPVAIPSSQIDPHKEVKHIVKQDKKSSNRSSLANKVFKDLEDDEDVVVSGSPAKSNSVRLSQRTMKSSADSVTRVRGSSTDNIKRSNSGRVITGDELTRSNSRRGSQSNISKKADPMDTPWNITEDIARNIIRDSAIFGRINHLLYVNKCSPEIALSYVEEVEKEVSKIIKTITLKHQFPISSEVFLEWLCENLPNLGRTFEYYVWYTLMKEKNDQAKPVALSIGTSTAVVEEEEKYEEGEALPLWPPVVVEDLDNANNHLRHWLLSSIIPHHSKSAHWKVLFSGKRDGQSFVKLCDKLFGYNGPTLMLVENDQNELFGAYVNEMWTLAKKFREDPSAFLFTLEPSFGVYRVAEDKNNIYMYNTQNNKGIPLGIGFGGRFDELKWFRLWIDEHLLSGKSVIQDSSYTIGLITAQENFKIKNIEFYGLGGESAEKEQREYKENIENEAERRKEREKQSLGSDLGLGGKRGQTWGTRTKRELGANED